MIRRADIEGSKSAVALYARVATSQFFYTALSEAFPPRLRALAFESRLTHTPDNLSVGNRLFLRLSRVHTFPVVETRSRSLVVCWSSVAPDYYPNVSTFFTQWFSHCTLGTVAFPDFPASRCVAREPSTERRAALAVEEKRCTVISTTGTLFVNPCGNFSDTSILRLVKIKDL